VLSLLEYLSQTNEGHKQLKKKRKYEWNMQVVSDTIKKPNLGIIAIKEQDGI
jgi:hypothetical protein